ncbi:CapA family protein [Candidatus Manganitrophus noduliformans]|uniref:CapA family protein n=1 Tax=Candidatus Manganitrophus noduliformans TaxID=2606439 RepID=A0A7X6IDY2_9BACT|nr:CapA family protein [Candidatus Manganitrophus noduliformans]NKE73806.1 CapA family protein [Candidatus Manganitrophus noduliformans]
MSTHSKQITLFLTGDVMTGRGVDQILPHPSDPHLHEAYMKSAAGYVELAEEANGPIPEPVGYSYIWGEVLEILGRRAPDVRIINLETAVTTSETWEEKGINYRMHPENIPCLTAARIDCAVLANNHVLDWGEAGLVETLETLRKTDIKTAGAGRTLDEAQAPAIFEVAGRGRVIVFGFGSESSGIPWTWAAKQEKPGVALLEDLSERTVRQIAGRVQSTKRPGDIVVASIHWGGNWGYDIPQEQIRFAHQLIDEAGVDVIHGHSSHHAKGIEVHREKPILYGCGDFLTDYEGIEGYETFRDDLALIYLATIDPSSGKLVRFEMVPFQMKRFRLHRASEEDARWLEKMFNREGHPFGTWVELKEDLSLVLRMG